MLLVVCVDLDDDIGLKTDVETPVIGCEGVREVAVQLATADPEDSDVNVLFQGIHIAETIDDERVVVAAVAGDEQADVTANRTIGDELDEILATLDTAEEVRALVVTDGAQDESVLPVIRSRVPVDGVQRVVVRQAQDLESMYYTIKQVLDDPETRGTLLVPLGILLLIYPLAIVASLVKLPGLVLGVTSGLLGLYLLGRGIGIEKTLDRNVERVRSGLYAGRVTIVTYLVATVLLVIGGYSGYEQLLAVQAGTSGGLGIPEQIAALAFGAIEWVAAAGMTTSVGQITDEYLSGRLEWRYLNAPVYVLSIAIIVHAVSAYVIVDEIQLPYLAAALTAGTLLGLASTLAFAIAESRFPRRTETA